MLDGIGLPEDVLFVCPIMEFTVWAISLSG